MSETIARFMGTNEEDDEEVIEVDIKGEDEDDDEENHIASSFMVNMDGRITTGFNSNPHQHCLHSPEQPSSRLGGGRRSRPLEEKERTKLRERHRRAITAKILAGLRRHGNYNLRVRADINDVIAALAREAGWVVLPDGTTFPAQSQGAKPSTGVSSSAAASSSDIIPQQTPSGSLQVFSSSYQSIEDQNSWDLKSVLMHTSAACDLSSASRSLASAIMGDEGRKNESYPLICGSNDAVDNKQVLHQPPKLQERDFSGTPYIPVYVMLPFGVINMNCELTDPDGLLKQLRYLKSINVDGIMVNCWWGVVEAHSPQEYKWVGYKKLFQIVRELKLKLQVVMSFHVCGGNFGDDLFIHLPHWVTEIGRTNPDIYFTDKDGRRNHECLSWGIDKERILRGRTAVEVYYDFMRSFRSEFDEFFEDGIISMIEVGLGPCGELRYPSYPVKHGWRYPGIGEFQVIPLLLKRVASSMLGVLDVCYVFEKFRH
ncbi:hypothetical protein Droror1_Dr00000532 [Drosera rotundifolia]